MLLAEIPGVTVEHITDVAGQADLALRFPFTDGVTEILFNASTYRLVGYVRNGTETVITKVAEVTGLGSLTPVMPIHPAAPLNKPAAAPSKLLSVRSNTPPSPVREATLWRVA